jgi:hypothetical protein
MTAVNINELIAEVAEEVRSGADLNTVVNEIATEAGVSVSVLAARVAKAYPAGITAPLPSEEEQVKRREQERRAEWAKYNAEVEAISDFFRNNPTALNTVRQNIRKMTGRKTCDMQTAMKIAKRLELI